MSSLEPQTMERSQLEAQLPPGLPLDFESTFPKLTGLGVRKRNRKKVELLHKLHPMLDRILVDGERVQFVGQGIVNLSWELIFMGIWAQLINKTALVLTDRRLLLFHLSGDEPESYVNQIPRASIKKVSGLFSLHIKLARGAVSVSGVVGADKKSLKQLVSKNPQARGGKEFLCSSCFEVHRAHTESCGHCGAEFKSPRTAALRSLLLPGLGDLYLGHRWLAVIEMVGAAFVWFLVILLLIGGPEAGDLLPRLLLAGFLLVFTNVLDAALTLAQGRKGLMSINGELGSGPGPAFAPIREY